MSGAATLRGWTLQGNVQPSPLSTASESRPVIASYCATFLKPEMLHIYRQITELKRCAPVVIAQKRENAERYPFEGVHIVPKPRTHVIRRFWFRQLRDKPWQISDAELSELLSVLSETRARLLHIYFGHIAVHLLPLIRAWKNPSIVSFHGADVMVDMNKPVYREATLQMLDAVKLVLVRSESLRRAVINLGCDPEKIRDPAHWNSAGGISISRPFCPKKRRMAIRAGGPIDRKKRSAGNPSRFLNLFEATPQRDGNDRRRRTFTSRTPEICARISIADRVSFTGFVSQEQLREIYYRSQFFCTRARLAATETRKEFRIQCSKQWLACPCSPPSTAGFPKQSRMV